MARPKKTLEEFTLEDFYDKFDKYMSKHNTDYITMTNMKIIIRTNLTNRKFDNVLDILEEVYDSIIKEGIFKESLLKLSKRYSVVLKRV